MEIQRTANSGVLLKMDGVSILLDGLADRVGEYLPTPQSLACQLLENPPDLLAFTHGHPDHCSEALLSPYRKQNLRPILGPELLHPDGVKVGNVTITPVPSRHIGKVEPGLAHHSFLITGSRCVWFMGDATPSQWVGRTDLPKPDVLIAPYAYANTESAWAFTQSVTEHLVLLHLPPKEADPFGLNAMVMQCVGDDPGINVYIPHMEERIYIA